MKMTAKLKKIISLLVKCLRKPFFTIDYIKLYLISNIKRYKTSRTNLLKNQLTFIDSDSFISMYNEIFDREIYKFNTNSSKPFIIDGGANIGLSVIYFSKKYPTSSIVAFEPDGKIFQVLTENIKSFKLNNAEIVNKGLWNKEDKLSFLSEGADGGRIATETSDIDKVSISTLSLRPYLNKSVSLLKLDIEGAELVVLEDCQDLLHNVDNLFVEYHSFNNNKQSLDTILNIMSMAGFRYYIESIGVSSKHPFISRDINVNIDLQLNIYACRN